MSSHFAIIVLVSFTAFSCSSYKSAKPTFDAKYKSDTSLGSGSEDAEGKVVSKGDSLGAGNGSGSVETESTTPILSQEAEAPSTTEVSFDLKNAMSYVSEKIVCDQDNKANIVGGALANDDDLVTGSTFRIVMNRSHYCTATLIGKNQLLTAAHCFDGIDSRNQIEIGFGTDGSLDRILKPMGFKIHPLYRGMAGIATPSPESQLYDIAIITFEGELSDKMIPVRLAESSYVYAGMHVVVAGYGAISTNDQARRPLAWLITELSSLSNKYNELQIKQKPGKGACYGDSGGPAYIVASDSRCLQLVGSISGPSRGTTNCDAGGGLLMDVTRQRMWIACNFKKMGYPLRYINTSYFDCSL